MEYKEIKVGSVITMTDEGMSNEMECVFRTIFNNNEYIVLHPADAPEDVGGFVVMRLIKEGMVAEYSEVVCERLVQLYFQFKEGRDKIGNST